MNLQMHRPPILSNTALESHNFYYHECFAILISLEYLDFV